ncbi:MAG: hypothetical protein ABIR06_09685 [Cyclobacteriaceae bacterium]
MIIGTLAGSDGSGGIYFNAPKIPIVCATYPLLAVIQYAQAIFHLVFFISP